MTVTVCVLLFHTYYQSDFLPRLRMVLVGVLPTVTIQSSRCKCDLVLHFIVSYVIVTVLWGGAGVAPW